MAENSDKNLAAFKAKATGINLPCVTVKPQPQKKAVTTVKDAFTFPKADHDLIQQLISGLMVSGVSANKSEIVRAGLHALLTLSVEERVEIVNRIEKLPRGRSKSG
ncbi:MAG: hypothetical protein IE914_04250 [Thiotrichales bacterium]|nr:hypothetical protein [Thiotrichales bacterium]